jgi:transcriptional regulator with XRE-family HTH domain
MTPKNQHMYMQTTFDKTFINVLEYLNHHKQNHMKFRFLKDLLSKLGLFPSNYSAIKKGVRGVPDEKIESIVKYLVKEFKVSEQYLRTGKGNMLTEPLPFTLKEDEVPYHTLHNTELNLLRIRVKHLEELLEEKDRMIAALNKHIAILEQE